MNDEVDVRVSRKTLKRKSISLNDSTMIARGNVTMRRRRFKKKASANGKPHFKLIEQLTKYQLKSSTSKKVNELTDQS